MSSLADLGNLKGRRAVVVGGGGGIGRAVTLALVGEGVTVAVADKNAAALEETAGSVAAAGVRIVSAVADVRDSSQLSAFYDLVDMEFPSLDILINVAGGVRRRPFMETTSEQRDEDIRLNYGYVLDSIQRAVPIMRRGARGGSIVNFTTIEAQRGAAGFSVYAGAKAALRNFTRALAVELGHERIRVNCIAPDSTPSAGNRNALAAETIAELERLPAEVHAAGVRMAIPMEEAVPEQQLANAALFLASDLSAYITGASLPVDGGTSASLGFVNWPFGDGPLPIPLAGTYRRLFADGQNGRDGE